MTRGSGTGRRNSESGYRDDLGSLSERELSSIRSCDTSPSANPVVAVATIDPHKCNLCGECDLACPMWAITLSEQSACVDVTRCSGCGACVVVCPREAVKLI